MKRVDRLVLIAGPPCSGKSTLIKSLQWNKMPLLSAQLKLDDPSLWKYFDARHLHGVVDIDVDRMILHYDFFRSWAQEQKFHQGYQGDNTLGILNTSNEITFLTLWATYEAMIQRRKSKRMGLYLKCFKSTFLGRTSERNRLFKRIQKLSMKPPELLFLYEKWFGFCGMYPSKAHLIVDTMIKPPTLLPLSQWPDIKGTWLNN